MKGKLIFLGLIVAIIVIIYFASQNQNPLQGRDSGCINDLKNFPLLADNQTISSKDPRIQKYLNDGCGAFLDSNGNPYPANSTFLITKHTQMSEVK